MGRQLLIELSVQVTQLHVFYSGTKGHMGLEKLFKLVERIVVVSKS